MAFPSENAFRYLTESEQWSAEPAGRLASYCMWEIMNPKEAGRAQDDESWLLEFITYETDRRAKDHLINVMNERLEVDQEKGIYIPAGDFFERLIQTAERQTDSLTTAKLARFGLGVMLRGSELYKPFFDWVAQRITDDTLDDKTTLHKTSLYEDYCPDGTKMSIHGDTARKMNMLVEKYPHLISPAYTEMCAMLASVPMVGQAITLKWNAQPHDKTEWLRITQKKTRVIAAIDKANTQGCNGLKISAKAVTDKRVIIDIRDLFPEPMIQQIDMAWRPVAAPNNLNLYASAINLQILPRLVLVLKSHFNAACMRPLSITYNRGYPIVPYTGPTDPK